MKRHLNRKIICDLSDELKDNFNNTNWKEESLEKIIVDLPSNILSENTQKNPESTLNDIFNNLYPTDINQIDVSQESVEDSLKKKYKTNEKNDNDQDVVDPSGSEDKNSKNLHNCDYCKKKYSRKDSLTRHLQSCLIKYFKEKQKIQKMEEEKRIKEQDFKDNNNSIPPSKNLEVVTHKKNKIYDWELYKSIIPYSPPIKYEDFSYYKGVCLIQMPFEDEFRDNHLSNDTKIRLFTSIHYPSLLYELMKNQHNANVVPENKETSIVYKKNGFIRVNNDFLTMETTLKLKKYFIKNYMNIKNFHPLIDSDLYSVMSDNIYKSILKKADVDYKSDFLKIFEYNKELFHIDEIVKNNNFLIEDMDMKDIILKKQFVFF